MKKLIYILLFLPFIGYSQVSDQALRDYADANINTNAANAITGAILNTYLNNSIDSKVNIDSATTVRISISNDSLFITYWGKDEDTIFLLAGNVTITNEGNNRVTTSTAATGVINAEANMTFDGTDLTLNTSHIIITGTGRSVFIGENAGLVDDLSDRGSVFVGYEAGKANTTGNFNTFAGYLSGTSNIGGANNSFFGSWSGFANTSGQKNTFIGSGAGQHNSTTDNNTYIGNDAGRYITSGSNPNSTGNNSVYIGYTTMANANAETNQIVIGANAIGKGSNKGVFGDDNITEIWMSEDGGAYTHMAASVLTNSGLILNGSDTTASADVIFDYIATQVGDGLSITNAGNNRLITSSGGTVINGEIDITFDGSLFSVNAKTLITDTLWLQDRNSWLKVDADTFRIFSDEPIKIGANSLVVKTDGDIEVKGEIVVSGDVVAGDGWKVWSPSLVWATSNPTITAAVYRYQQINNTIYFTIDLDINNDSPGDVTDLTITLPVIPKDVNQLIAISKGVFAGGGWKPANNYFPYVDAESGTAGSRILKHGVFTTIANGAQVQFYYSGFYEVD